MSDAEIDRLRAEVQEAVGEYRRARRAGKDLVAASAAGRVQTLAAALTALALTEPQQSFDEHGATACRATFREVTK